MSEALSSSEIEDVLSSIRRLVSDDLRPSTVRTGQPAPRPADEAEKLLLTPALRVVQAENAAAADEPRPIDDVVATVSAGVAQQADDWESETGDSLPDTGAEAPMAEVWTDAPTVDAYAEPVSFIYVDKPAAAEAEAVEVAQDAEGDAVDVVASGAAEEAVPLPGWAQSPTGEEEDQPRADPWAGGTVEPDRAWADEAEAEVLQELTGAQAGRVGEQPPRQAEPDHSSPDADFPDDAPLPVDEAMLREIVRDVLREELQGRLGERITRNIRKLVRAEIARVMASEDLL